MLIISRIGIISIDDQLIHKNDREGARKYVDYKEDLEFHRKEGQRIDLLKKEGF